MNLVAETLFLRLVFHEIKRLSGIANCLMEGSLLVLHLLICLIHMPRSTCGAPSKSGCLRHDSSVSRLDACPNKRSRRICSMPGRNTLRSVELDPKCCGSSMSKNNR